MKLLLLIGLCSLILLAGCNNYKDCNLENYPELTNITSNKHFFKDDGGGNCCFYKMDIPTVKLNCIPLKKAEVQER